MVDIDAPQAIGVLTRIMRRLEEYQAVRTTDPRSTYDDVAMAKAIWEEEGAEDGVDQGDRTETRMVDVDRSQIKRGKESSTGAEIAEN